MNDEVKEILIDLIDYYNIVGTDKDPGFEPFAKVVGRASKALEREAAERKRSARLRSADVDPYAMDVVGMPKQMSFEFKHENEW